MIIAQRLISSCTVRPTNEHTCSIASAVGKHSANNSDGFISYVLTRYINCNFSLLLELCELRLDHWNQV